MSHNRGTQLVNVPIRFRTYSYALDWEIIRKNEGTVFEGSRLSPLFAAHKAEKLGDGWELIRRFLSLDGDDDEAILKFLMAYGQFLSPMAEPIEVPDVILPVVIGRLSDTPKPRIEPRKQILERIPKQAFATVQHYLRRMLLAADPTLPTPWETVQQYSIRFTRTRTGSQAEVIVPGVFPSMLATVQFKLAQGATFKACARKDCRLPFEVSSRHKRRFCTQYCAHITSLRKRRKLQRTITHDKGTYLKGR